MSEDTLHGEAHAAVWPLGVPTALSVPDESLWCALARRAQTDGPAKALHFLGRSWTWQALHDEAQRLAGALQGLGVARGDRVLLFMQNCPQFIVACYGVWRAGAVVVPVNPMNKSDELGHYLVDAGAQVALAASDIAPELARASDALGPVQALKHLVVFDMADGLPADTADAADSPWPQSWRAWLTTRHPAPPLAHGTVTRWAELLAQASAPHAFAGQGSDLALLPYTSGTTGAPKGCRHPHRTLLHNALSGGPWLDMRPGDATLIVVPMFHITGLVMGLLATVANGGRIVLLPRWDRDLAAHTIAEQRVTHWPNIPTMVIDLLGAPDLDRYDLRCLRYIGGGGAPMPEAIAQRLNQQFGLEYLEGYGLTETAAPTHCNPRGGARRQCLGIPYLSTVARVIDPETLADLPDGEVGEIIVSGPQVFEGYWQQPQATAAAFLEREGRRFFRTGDLGRRDAQGYYTLADRLKRMINASGFKVWPAEVEALLYRHPGVQEACVIATRDPYRGESVKAVVVPKPEAAAQLSADALIAWAREHMAAYKVPRTVEFAERLPRSASGKLMWRQLQTAEDARQSAAQASSAG